MISVTPADLLFVCGKNFNVAIFSDTINMINVKSCMMVVLLELYTFIPLSVTLIVFWAVGRCFGPVLEGIRRSALFESPIYR